MNKKINNDEDDIVFEAEESSVDPVFFKKINKIKKELEKCKKEKEEYLDGWQRSQADFINYKKRANEDTQAFRKYANEDLILSVLPTLDNFEAALKDHGEGAEIKKWKTGFEHIYNQLKKTLEIYGVEQLNPVDENFDPKIHESVEMIETEDKKLDHKISEVVMRGYKIGDKILRSPQVKIWVLK